MNTSKLDKQFANWAKRLLKANPDYVNDPKRLIPYLKGPNWDEADVEYAHYRQYIALCGNELLEFFTDLRNGNEEDGENKYLEVLKRFNENEFGICDYEFVVRNGKLIHYNGKAKEVRIPNGVKSIGEKAFEKNETIEKVFIPDSVTAIGEFAFNGCTNLKSVRLPKNLRFLKEATFCGCKSLERIQLPSTLEVIGDSALCYTSLKSVKLPKTLVRIERFAFYASPLKSIVIPNGVEEVNETAFKYCPISKATLPKRICENWRIYGSCTIKMV